MNKVNYKATLDQLGTSSPQAYQRENSIGNAELSRIDVGISKLFFDGKLPTSGVFFCPQNNQVFNANGTPFVLKVDHSGNGEVTIQTLDMNLNPMDECLSGTPIEIEFYETFETVTV